jgi:hypothetical protein
LPGGTFLLSSSVDPSKLRQELSKLVDEGGDDFDFRLVRTFIDDENGEPQVLHLNPTALPWWIITD